MSVVQAEMINIGEKFKQLEWWDRPINETSYDSDDLAKIILAVDWILSKTGYGVRMDPVQVWFGEYNPGKSANEGGNGLPKSVSSLVKTTRYGDREIRTFSPFCNLEEPKNSTMWLSHRYGHVMRKKKQEYVSHSSRSYNLVGIATPNIKNFEAENATEVVLMGQGRAPKELMRQIAYYLLARAMGADFTESKYGGRQCDLSDHRWVKIDNLWTQELYSQLPLHFSSSCRVKKKTNGIRQAMAYFREQNTKAQENVECQVNSYSKQLTNLKARGKEVKEAQAKQLTAVSRMTDFILALGQGKNSIYTAAQAAPTQEKDNA